MYEVLKNLFPAIRSDHEIEFGLSLPDRACRVETGMISGGRGCEAQEFNENDRVFNKLDISIIKTYLFLEDSHWQGLIVFGISNKCAKFSRLRNTMTALPRY